MLYPWWWDRFSLVSPYFSLFFSDMFSIWSVSISSSGLRLFLFERPTVTQAVCVSVGFFFAGWKIKAVKLKETPTLRRAAELVRILSTSSIDLLLTQKKANIDRSHRRCRIIVAVVNQLGLQPKYNIQQTFQPHNYRGCACRSRTLKKKKKLSVRWAWEEVCMFVL